MADHAPPPSPPPLFGRERAQATLREALAAALAGRGSLVLIGGEAGIGKTALAEGLLAEAAALGAHVLVGRCYDLSETPPYGPWVELFARYHPGAAAPPLPPAFARPGTVGAVTSQAALCQQVLDCLAALAARHPLVVLLDDAHWMDAASLDLLRVLARHLAAHALLLLVAYRADDLPRRHPLAALLPLLARESRAERLDLQALDDGAVRALVHERYHLPDGDRDRLLAYLQGRAQGNALFVGELLRWLEGTGVLAARAGPWTLGSLADRPVPPLVRQVIDARVARFDDEGQRLLAVAAVIGQVVALDVWAAVAEAGEAAVADLAERAEEACLLGGTPEGAGVQFAHALIREALYEGLPSVRRRRLHRRAGEVLAAGRNPDPDAVAYHFQRADDERALPWLLRAGARAQGAYAWTAAAARFAAALTLMERADADAGERGWLLLRLARLVGQVEVAQARALVEEARALAGRAGDPALAAFARYQRGQFACAAGDVAAGLPELEGGAAGLAALSAGERATFAAHAASFAASPEPDGRGTVVLWRAFMGRFREARDLGEQVIAETAGGGEAAIQRVRGGYFGLGEAYAALGMPAEAAAMYAVTYAACLRAGDHAPAADSCWRHLTLVALPYRAEDIAGRRLLGERAAAEWARAGGAVPAAVSPRFMLVPVLIVEGHWEEAEGLALAGSAARQGSFGYRAVALGHLATLSRLRGDTARARWAVREWLPTGAATAPGAAWPFDAVAALQRVAAALAVDDGDLAAAQAWLAAHDRWLAWGGATLWRAEGRLGWAAYHRAAGDLPAARAHAEAALAHAGAPRQPLALLAARRLLGELATAVGRHADAAGHLAAALALAEACAAPYERALCLLALAELRAATGDRDGAGVALAEARTLLAPLGAQPALARAAALAARHAAPPRGLPVPAALPFGLTAREAEVLRLVAAGLPNEAIGARLFLSPRTVSTHLTHIYAKLGVDGRPAAIRAALDHGLR